MLAVVGRAQARDSEVHDARWLVGPLRDCLSREVGKGLVPTHTLAVGHGVADERDAQQRVGGSLRHDRPPIALPVHVERHRRDRQKQARVDYLGVGAQSDAASIGGIDLEEPDDGDVAHREAE